MANKNINILLSLQDKFSKPVKETGAATKAAAKQIKASSNIINGWANNANRKFLNVSKAAGKVALGMVTLGGAVSVAGVKMWSNEAIEGFNKALEAETKLEAVLKNVPAIIKQGALAAAEAKDRLVAMADAMEETGIIAGDITTAGLQQMATFQLSEKSLHTLSGGMADLLAQQKGLNATQEDAVSIGNLIGKAMSGQASALTRVGIIMDENQKKILERGTEEQKAAVLAKVLEQNVGGVNKALAQTDAGKILVTQNLLGRASDEIGGRLMALKAQIYSVAAKYIPELQGSAMKLLDRAGPKVEQAIGYLESHGPRIRAGLAKAKTAVSAAYQVVKTAFGWIRENSELLIPVLSGVVAGFVAFNVVTKVAAGLAVLKTVIAGVSAAGGVLNAVLAANPIILVAMAVAALVAAGIALYRNWDTVSAKATELWGKVKEVGAGIRSALVDAFESAREKVRGVIDWISGKIDNIGEAIRKVPVLGKLFDRGGGDKVSIPTNATGTSYFRGGLTRVNEGGRGEIVSLPGGTKIIPHDVAKKQPAGGPRININLTVQGNVIGNREYMEQCGRYVADRVLVALGTV